MRIYKVALFLSAQLAGQLLHLPTPGVPRNADGSPNLAAPAPKAASGKPDFSGMWIARDEIPCNVKERGVQCSELPLTPQVINIAAGLKDGLPSQPWAADLVKKRAAELGVNDPTRPLHAREFSSRVGLPRESKNHPNSRNACRVGRI